MADVNPGRLRWLVRYAPDRKWFYVNMQTKRQKAKDNKYRNRKIRRRRKESVLVFGVVVVIERGKWRCTGVMYR